MAVSAQTKDRIEMDGLRGNALGWCGYAHQNRIDRPQGEIFCLLSRLCPLPCDNVEGCTPGWSHSVGRNHLRFPLHPV